jgi:hypothetical protein
VTPAYDVAIAGIIENIVPPTPLFIHCPLRTSLSRHTFKPALIEPAVARVAVNVLGNTPPDICD